MSTDSDDVTAIAHVTKEFTFIDPLSDGECMALIQTAEAPATDEATADPF